MGKRKWRRITPEVRRDIVAAAARGATYEEIAAMVSRSRGAVGSVLQSMGGVIRGDALVAPPGRLSIDDRVEIRLGLERGESYATIGARVGRHASSVCREVKANGGPDRYRPMVAHRAAAERARRPKTTKLAAHQRLRAEVTAGLEKLRSPQQVSHRLREDFPDDPEMRVSHETIYKSIYVQGRGELRRELAACLRTGRAVRRPRGRLHKRGLIPDKVMISERPAEVADRAVPGHWEGDLIIGKAGKSAIGTLVERTTRFVLLLHLPGDHGAETVREAITTGIQTLPEALVRTITWDQGKEMTQHVRFSVDSGVAVYFCDPHSPWQRGSNENTNGLLRQYFPKGTDLSVHGPAVLQAAADSLNDRPRQTLGWKNPAEKLAELIAATG